MKKTIRLTESQLETLIERTLTESKKAKVQKKMKPGVNKTKAKPFGKLKEEVEMDEDVFLSEEQVNEIFGFSAKERFNDHYNEFTKVWMAKGVPAPNKDEIMAQAQADGFEGKLKLAGEKGNLKAAKFVYVPASKINWKSDFKSGGTGGQTAAGGV